MRRGATPLQPPLIFVGGFSPRCYLEVLGLPNHINGISLHKIKPNPNDEGNVSRVA